MLQGMGPSLGEERPIDANPWIWNSVCPNAYGFEADSSEAVAVTCEDSYWMKCLEKEGVVEGRRAILGSE